MTKKIKEEVINEPKEEVIDKPKERKFPKEEILKFKDFSAVDRDFLSAYLPKGNYTINEVAVTLENIKKGVVE